MTQQQGYAKRAIAALVKMGSLFPAKENPCFMCGGPAVDYHHFLGYAYPYHVIPLCRRCHILTDRPQFSRRKRDRFDRLHKGHGEVGRRRTKSGQIYRFCVSCRRQYKNRHNREWRARNK